jgi:hypothetical protein
MRTSVSALAELMVRIHSPPAESQQTFGSSNDGGPLFDRMIPLPSSGPWDEKDLIGNPPLPTFVEAVGPAGRGLAMGRKPTHPIRYD